MHAHVKSAQLMNEKCLRPEGRKKESGGNKRVEQDKRYAAVEEERWHSVGTRQQAKQVVRQEKAEHVAGIPDGLAPLPPTHTPPSPARVT